MISGTAANAARVQRLDHAAQTAIGAAAVFLASKDASYINGISLRVDGGHQAVCV